MNEPKPSQPVPDSPPPGDEVDRSADSSVSDRIKPGETQEFRLPPRAAAPQPLPFPTAFSRYQVRSILGQGAIPSGTARLP